MGVADFFARGEWNFYCDLCGAKRKSSDGRKTWDNQWVCKYHKEVRNPQDFLKGVKDDQAVPWSVPVPPYTYVSSTSVILATDGTVLKDKTGQPITDKT